MFLSPTQAGDLMRRCRAAVAKGAIKAEVTAVLDYLLWLARPPGADRCQVSLASMQRNLHLRRQKLVDGIRALEQLGVLRKLHTRVRVAWQGLMASRQGTNIYVFMSTLGAGASSDGARAREEIRAPTGFPSRTPSREGREDRAHRPSQPLPITPTRPSARPGASALDHALACLGRALVNSP